MLSDERRAAEGVRAGEAVILSLARPAARGGTGADRFLRQRPLTPRQYVVSSEAREEGVENRNLFTGARVSEMMTTYRERPCQHDGDYLLAEGRCPFPKPYSGKSELLSDVIPVSIVEMGNLGSSASMCS